jgi:hypothetical protein
MGNETRRSSVTRLLTLFCLVSGFGFAGTWSGTLVDAKCYKTLEQNHNLYDSTVDRDLDLEIRLCTPKAKTHSFAIVQPDGADVTLDSTGNAKAAELVRHAAAKPPLYVIVNGEMNNKTIAVNSITPAK